mgnify:CR=1 FL=1
MAGNEVCFLVLELHFQVHLPVQDGSLCQIHLQSPEMGCIWWFNHLFWQASCCSKVVEALHKALQHWFLIFCFRFLVM